MTLTMRTAESGETLTQLICPRCVQVAAANHVFCGNCGTKLSALDLPTVHINHDNPSFKLPDHLSKEQTKLLLSKLETLPLVLDARPSVTIRPKGQPRISRRRSLQLLGGIAVLATAGFTGRLVLPLRESSNAQASITRTPKYTYYSNQGPISSVVWNPLSSRTVGWSIASCSMNSSDVQIWDGFTGKQAMLPYSYDHSHSEDATNYDLTNSGITSLAWCHSGNKMVLGNKLGTAQIWVAETATYRNTLVGHTASVGSVDWAQDGKHIATGSDDMTVGIWSLYTPGDWVAQNFWGRGHAGAVKAVRFSGDSNYVVSTSDDGTAKIWSVQDGSNPYTYTGHKSQDAVNAVACSTSTSPSSSNLLIATASGDKTVRVWSWDSQTRKATDRQSYTGHQAAVTSLAWLPSSNIIASGDIWGQLHLWRCDTGKPLLILPDAHTDVINALAWSPQGDYLASAGQDKIVQVYEMPH